MSGGLPPAPPPAPMGLPPPKRGLRSLNVVPAVLAGSAAVGVCGLVLWTIMSLQDGPAGQASAGDTGSSQGSGAADILANAPNGNEIAAYRMPVANRFIPSTRQDPEPKRAQTPPEDIPPDMTETAIAARKAAWGAYYQALAERERSRVEGRIHAMNADTEIDIKSDAGPTLTGRPQIGEPGSPADRTHQESQRDFLSQAGSNPATDYSPFTLTDPISPYELKATDMVTGKLISQLNSDSPGILKAMVTKNVFDHATGKHILIPQGSTLKGVYATDIAYGQKRVTTAWQRIIYPPPCDQSLDLGAMPGADQTGQAGFQDITDNHLAQVFGAAILVSIFSAASQLSQPAQSSFSSYSPYQSAAGAVGQQTTQIGSEFARKGLAIAPTEQVRNGYNFGVFLTRDIAFAHPWVPGVCGGNSIEVASR